MEQYLRDIAQLIITPALFIAALTYISKKFLELTFSKNLDKFKIELQADANRRLFEFQTQFSQLHQRRIDIVGHLYEFLSKEHPVTFPISPGLCR